MIKKQFRFFFNQFFFCPVLYNQCTTLKKEKENNSIFIRQEEILFLATVMHESQFVHGFHMELSKSKLDSVGNVLSMYLSLFNYLFMHVLSIYE